MALVKTNKITPDKDPEAARGTAATDSRKRARTYAKQQKGAEQIAAATQELSAGVTQASASADRLQTSMEQISTGAQEAAQTAETSREATTESNRLLTEAAAAAQQSLDKTNLLQELVGELGGTVSESIENIRTAANRQAQSVEMIQELESQAASIGDIVQAVARIADQTNLLALNAAIEAARAGQHGKGFAVVADEVRTLAETSEKSAEHIEQLVKTIQSEVSGIGASIRETAETASSEAERGREVIERLTGTKTDMAEVAKGAQAILRGAEASSAAATQAQSSSESISAASEQQAAAVEEALRTLEAQTASLQQCDSSSQQLSELADELRE
ncbi:MAG: methyl-accepting chemotaxis protein, partial [Myxococcota bacterium]